MNAKIALVTVQIQLQRTPQAPTSWKVIYETYLEEQFDSQMESIKMKTLP